MESWRNGAKGSEVKSVIDKNFDTLDKQTKKINNDVSKLLPISIEFVASNWDFIEDLKTYIISIPYSTYNRENPCADVYIKSDGNYSLVYGGCIISESGIELQADIPYEGKVVIR